MRRLLLGVLLLPLLVIGAAGCTCDGLCRDRGTVREFDATLVARQGSVLTFLPTDGSEPVRVAVEENSDMLDVDRDYSVVAVSAGLRTDVEWSSQLNARCGCDDLNITNIDGSSIDTGWWARTKDAVPFTAIIVIVLAIPAATMLFVAGHRFVRGGGNRPLDVDGMPFDEWIEYDDSG